VGLGCASLLLAARFRRLAKRGYLPALKTADAG
jgi:hypothetical protein